MATGEIKFSILDGCGIRDFHFSRFGTFLVASMGIPRHPWTSLDMDIEKKWRRIGIAAAAGVVASATVADRVVVAVGAGAVVIATAAAVVVAVCVTPVVVGKAEPITSKPSNPRVCLAHPKNT